MTLTTFFILALTTLCLTLAWALWRARRAVAASTGQATCHDLKFGAMASISAHDGLVIQNTRGITLWVNPAYCDMMGWREDELIGRNPLTYALPPENRPTDEEIANFCMEPGNDLFEKLQVSEVTLFENVRKSGERFWIQISLSYNKGDDGETYVILVCRDVTAQVHREEELKETSDQLAFAASHDALTGAANRTKLLAYADSTLEAARINQDNVGLFQIDLDRFKEINDLHGHFAGDAILKHVTNAVTQMLGEDDLMARMGGDEFVVIRPQVSDIEALRHFGAQMREAIQKPCQWEAATLYCDASIGAALSENGRDSIEDLMHKADFALYDVKRAGRGAVAVFDAHLDRRQRRRSQRINEIVAAVDTPEIQFRFAPFGMAETGAVVGFETQAHWQHPTKGLLGPQKFLSTVHDLGLISRIDARAVIAAADLRRRLLDAGHGHVRVSFHCAGESMINDDYRQSLQKTLRDKDLAPADMLIEVRESTALDATDRQRQQLDALHRDGFAILLNDFSADIRGLANLGTLPISGFKITRDTMDGFLCDDDSRKMAGMIIDRATKVGLLAIVKGIETPEQARQVAAFGGQLIEGPLFAAPLPADQILPWLGQHAATGWQGASAIAPADLHRYLRANS